MAENEFLEFLRKHLDRPCTIAELRKKVPLRFREHLRKQLKPLVEHGEIVRIRGGRYGLPDEMNLVTGRVHAHPDGFGFVIPDDRTEKDVYIGPRNFLRAMHGDRVVCRVESVNRDGKREGSVIRILERASESVVGVFESRGRGGLVVPSQKRITQVFHVAPGDSMRAKSGQVVMADILEYPDRHAPPSARVTEILGFPGDIEVEKKIILRQYDLPEKFPARVEKTASRAKEPTRKDYKNRLDLTNDWIVTIDGETARDFDDAVSIKKRPDGFELGVHIADVSSYVEPGSVVDAEGYARGNSTYFPGDVIPMLPFHLSNNVCSLKEGLPRLTLSCVMNFDRKGNLVGYRLAPSVIKSRHRMTYTEAGRIIENPKDEPDSEKASKLTLMKKLSDLLRRNRSREGSIDFDLPESSIVLDMRGEPEDIVRSTRNAAHLLIEEFMLAANRAAADFLQERPAVYRVHPEPDEQAINNFFDLAKRLGHKPPKTGNLHNRLKKVVRQAEGKPEEKLLNYFLLRSMKQASYSVENVGHFGLAFSHYTHFTSPIRRYPDLVVHRLIKATLNREKRWPLAEELEKICDDCSKTERNSEQAERDIVEMLKVRFVAGREGEVFDGIVSGVTSFGLFIELGDIMVEGLLRLTDLHDDYYEFLESEYALAGKRTGKIYRFGQMLKVRIVNVDLPKRQIQLEPADIRKTGRRRPSGKPGKPDKPGRRGGRGRKSR